jgi:hypothetical protein
VRWSRIRGATGRRYEYRFSYTLSSYNPELYCELRKHFDYIWFEMQHSTMSYDEVRRMLLACPGPTVRRR